MILRPPVHLSQVLQRASSLPAARLLVGLVGVGTLHGGLRRRHPITAQNLRERQRLSRMWSGTLNDGNFRLSAESGLPPVGRRYMAFPTCEEEHFPPQSFSPPRRSDDARSC